MDFKTFLEMPINKFELLGKWDKPKIKGRRSLGYYHDDIGILTNEKGVNKIKAKWAKCEQNFDLFFLRNKGSSHPDNTSGRVILPEELEKLLGIKIVPDFNAISVVFTNNRGDERIPLNYWAIAHRFGHMISKEQGFEYLKKELRYEFGVVARSYGINQIDEEVIRGLFTVFGSMKSARDNNLRNIYEFYYELIAQYITTGKVTFNNPPQTIIVNKRRYNLEDKEIIEYLKDHIEPFVNNEIDSILNSALGKIFLM